MVTKKILFIAYLYPPVGGKGLPGVQRTVKFLRYLQQADSYVLTMRTDLYPEFFPLEYDITLPVNNEKIIRTGTFDIFKQLLKLKKKFTFLFNKGAAQELNRRDQAGSFSGSDNVPRKKSLLAAVKDAVSGLFTFPDFANPWIIPAVLEGRKLVKKEGIDFVFATGLPWSSLLIGWLIKLSTGVRLVIDFRDPWVNNPFALDKTKFRKSAEKFLERRIVAKADIVSLNTDELREDFLARYASLPRSKFIVLPNGYDTHDFHNLPSKDAGSEQTALILSHAGFLYGVRDPKPIFEAIKLIRQQEEKLAHKIIFRQMGNTELGYDLPKYVQRSSFMFAPM